MPDKKDMHLGLYQKYEVSRADGSGGPDGKHEFCQYFVLDMDHDPHAVAAIEAYMNSCQWDYPVLAHELRVWVAGRKSGLIPLRQD